MDGIDLKGTAEDEALLAQAQDVGAKVSPIPTDFCCKTPCAECIVPDFENRLEAWRQRTREAIFARNRERKQH